jgi:hypothetical protein
MLGFWLLKSMLISFRITLIPRLIAFFGVLFTGITFSPDHDYDDDIHKQED